MSPKIVDKKIRRKEIAIQAYEYLIKVGIENFTTTGLIKFIGVGKSSLYNYFKSKDEIVQEVIYQVMMVYMSEMETRLKKTNSFKEKLLTVFEFYLLGTQEYKEGIKIYREYFSIYYDDKSHYVVESNKKMFHKWRNLVKNITKKEIDKGKIKKESLNMVYGLICTADGMMMYDGIVKEFSLQNELKKYIDTFIELVEI